MTQKECYAVLKKAIEDNGFEVKYYDQLISPDQTPHVSMYIGEGPFRHDCAFALHIVEGLGEDPKLVYMTFTGSCRIMGGKNSSKVMMQIATELRNGARLLKFLESQELTYPNPNYKPRREKK